MARIAISEWAAKRLLVGESYMGVSATAADSTALASLAEGNYVVKVDDGTKKRNQLGLVVVGCMATEAKKQAEAWLEAGYRRVLVEPLFEHSVADEQYISCSVVREGLQVLYKSSGGNSVEESDTGVETVLVPRSEFLSGELNYTGTAPLELVERIVTAMRQYQLLFVEVNPFVVAVDGAAVCLDAAVEIDSTKLATMPHWVTDQVQGGRALSAAEVAVAELDGQSTAAFSLTVFDPEAAIFTLLSGGGASLVTIDTLVDQGLQAAVATYGEYSGGPTRAETKRYTEVLLKLMFASKAPRKVLVIAGGVANFTDVMTTFSGIIDACSEYVDQFKQADILVRVRRGGPRQHEGLAQLEKFFKDHGINAVVSDPSVPLSQVAVDVDAYLNNKSI